MPDCRFPGCRKRPTVTVDADEAWCSTHARGEADKLLRQHVMERDLRICQRCGGGAHDAAHLIPRSRAPFLHWQPENVRALCRPCHQTLDASPTTRQIWAEARWPGMWEGMWRLQMIADAHAIRRDLGQVIRDLREPAGLTMAEAARYQTGDW